MSVLQTRIEPLPDYIKRPEAENTSQQQESIEQTDKPDQPEEPKWNKRCCNIDKCWNLGDIIFLFIMEREQWFWLIALQNEVEMDFEPHSCP